MPITLEVGSKVCRRVKEATTSITAFPARCGVSTTTTSSLGGGRLCRRTTAGRFQRPFVYLLLLRSGSDGTRIVMLHSSSLRFLVFLFRLFLSFSPALRHGEIIVVTVFFVALIRSIIIIVIMPIIIDSSLTQYVGNMVHVSTFLPAVIVILASVRRLNHRLPHLGLQEVDISLLGDDLVNNFNSRRIATYVLYDIVQNAVQTRIDKYRILIECCSRCPVCPVCPVVTFLGHDKFHLMFLESRFDFVLCLSRRYQQQQLHLGSLYRHDVLQQFDAIQVLSFQGFRRMDRKIGLLHGMSNLGNRVRTIGFRMDAVFGYPFGNLCRRFLQLLCPFLVRNLQLSLDQNELGNLFFVLGAKHLLKVFRLGKFSFTHIRKDTIRLQDFREILLHTLAIINDLIAVAGYFEAFATLVHSDNGHIGQFNLTNRLVDLSGHDEDDIR
mmetsp:Transcript_23320/g.41365  ORF Transcript_23320/g.41365 Transcript_23320/m.41365 type:complete len:439 (-) Transcript_23320:37-1353(-)